MPIALTCTGCKSRHLIKDEHAGVSVLCTCGQTLTVPLPLPGAAPAPPPRARYPHMIAAASGAVAAGFAIGAFLLIDALVLNPSPKPSTGGAETAQLAKSDIPKQTETEPKPPEPVEKSPKETAAPASAEQVYKRLLKSTAWIVVTPRGGGVGWGSGALVHQDRRLVFTNFHVIEKVGDGESVLVFFPHYRGQGKERELVTSPQAYIDKNEQWGVPGRVVFREKSTDLALVQLDRDPEGVPAIPLAGKSAAVGQNIYSIGNSGATDGTLWRLTPGQVRQVYEKKVNFSNGQNVDAWIVETQAPVNPGDSGGPVVNDRAQVVAVVSSYQTNKQLVSSNIDVRELRSVVQNYFKKENLKWEEPAAPDLVDPDQVLVLLKQLEDKDVAVRARAARALGNLGSEAQTAVPALLKLWNDSDPVVRQQVGVALDRIGPPAPSDMAAVVAALADTRVEVRRYAARTIAQLGPEARDAADALGRASQDMDVEVRRKAVQALARLAGAEKRLVAAPLVQALKDSDNTIRKEAASGLAAAGPDVKADAFTPLMELLADADPAVVAAAANALPALGPPEATDLLTLNRALKHNSAQVRIFALRGMALAKPSDKAQLSEIARRLRDPVPEVRETAALALGAFGAKSNAVLTEIVEGMKDESPAVRRRLVEVMGRIGGEPGVITALMAALNDTDPNVTSAVQVELKRLRTFTKADLPELVKGLQSKAVGVRFFVLDAFEQLGAEAAPAAPDLQKLLKDPSVRIRLRTVKLLGGLGPQARPAVAALAEALNDKLPSTGEVIDFEPATPASTPASGPKTSSDPAEIRKVLLASAAWVCWRDGLRGGGSGTACVVDVPGRLILTNYRAVGKQSSVMVFFPKSDKDSLVVDQLQYLGNPARMGVTGTVVATDPSRDLALIRVPRLSAGAKSLPLAAQVNVGDSLQALGGSAFNPRQPTGLLWQSQSAKVSAIAAEQFQVFDSRAGFRIEGPQQINARVVKADASLSPGDGGGPVVNERGEIVAVVSGEDRSRSGIIRIGSRSAGTVHAIEVSEIRAFLEPHRRTRPAEVPTTVKGSTPAMEVAYRRAILAALKGIGPGAGAAVPALEKVLDEKDSTLRQEVITALGSIGGEASSSILLLLRSVQNDEEQTVTLNAIGGMGKEAIPVLLKTVIHQDPAIRTRSALALGRFAKDLKPYITRLQRQRLEERNATVKAALTETLNKIGPP